jgi:GH35 family endo-1,4-beta-xylanase
VARQKRIAPVLLRPDLLAEAAKTPLDYIGFQNHVGIGAPDPEAVLKTLDQFATLRLPIQVTEFEVTLQNGNDPKQRAYQADYVRDYFTAVFSHPSTRGILLQDFWQPGAWQYEGASAFFNKDWSLNPHGKVYEDLV